MSNVVGWVIATGYVFVVIGAAEGLRRWQDWPTYFTRKVVHIGVGMLIWMLPFLFTSATPFILTALLFAGLTFLDNIYHFFPAMAGEANNWGTTYFPLAAIAVAALFWETPALMAAALMPLTWGDGMAEVMGRKFGRNPYTIFNHTRTLEGSAAFFLFSFVAILLALQLMPNPFAVSLGLSVALALIISLVCTIIEAFSIGGLDNLTVTAAAIGIVFYQF